jgi:hypothetical protein
MYRPTHEALKVWLRSHTIGGGMPNHVEQQIDRANGVYGQLNTVNDTLAGGQGSTLTSLARYAAQAGGRLILDYGGVQGVSTGLYGGWFQYVQILSTATQVPALGKAVFWNDYENYIVTTDYTANNVGRIAGILTNTSTYPVAKGNWCWIQTKGKAKVTFGTIAKATPADGDLVIINTGSVGDVPSNGDTQTMTGLLMKQAIGVALSAPVSSTASLVLLRWMPDVI